jgi:ubiquitin C-terminal hydrolase
MGKGSSLSSSASTAPLARIRGGRQESPPVVFTFHEGSSHPLNDATASVATTATTSAQSYSSALLHRPKGLRNVGNTCYANAVLQCLLSTALTQALLDPTSCAIFRRYASNPNLLDPCGSFDSRDSRKSARSAKPDKQLRDKCKWLTRELKAITVEYHITDDTPDYWLSLMKMASWSHGPVVDPGSITKHPDRLSPCLRPFQQEDAHEFLRALLSTLVMNGQNKRLSSLFDGLLESSVSCQNCKRPSLTRDRYMDLSLDIHQSHIHTLTDALSDFTAEETLTGDNAVHCKHCRSKQTATKALRLATAPSILVCHLKRFALDPYGRLVRVHKHVPFSERLEIGEFMSSVNKSRPPPYDLVSLLVHQGSSCDSGHYIAFTKHAGEWYQCNDSVVEKVDVKTVLAQQAYLLLYEVADMRENHGYPSPHAYARIERPLMATQFMCGLDDTILRDLCCYDTTNSLFPERRRARARDDSTLEESTTSSFQLRRSSSGGHVRRSQKLYGRSKRQSYRRPVVA